LINIVQETLFIRRLRFTLNSLLLTPGYLTGTYSSTLYNIPSVYVQNRFTTYSSFSEYIFSNSDNLAPIHFQCKFSPSMNYNVLFKGWLFLSLPFDRLRKFTIFYALILYLRTLTKVLVVPISTKELSPLVLHLIY